MAQSALCKVYERLGTTALASDGIRPGGAGSTERALRFCRFAPDSVVLDVGCGNGATLARLQGFHGLRAVGMDASSRLLAEARGRHASPSLVHGVGEALPFSGESFDGVILECTLSLIEDRRTALRECGRVLRPGGRIIVSDIYARNEVALSGLRSLPADCCLRGAAGKDDVPEALDAAGFTVDLWEDHSDALKDFAVRLVWQYGSIPSFLGLEDEQQTDREKTSASIRECRPGYFLLVARKER